ncbi:MAG TPA: 50S ribosomal protein L30 [Bacteroidales bacterium]|nr:50S ribosomal protein L30 [Bacteroidales bacterium]
MSKLKVTLVKSKSRVCERQLRTIKALGLGRRTSSVVVESNDVFKGMISKVHHLVKVEEV